MQYATSFNALHLILAQMGTAPLEARRLSAHARRAPSASSAAVCPGAPAAVGAGAGRAHPPHHAPKRTAPSAPALGDGQPDGPSPPKPGAVVVCPGPQAARHAAGGAWLHRGESIQRILKRRGVDGQHPQTPDERIPWLEAAVRGWKAAPTPFQWGGKCARRRQRSRERRHRVGGAYAFTRRPLRRARTGLEQWQSACQTTH
jgi:hypothetical protein